MIELNGKHNSAKIFTDLIDRTAVAQIIEFCNQEFSENSIIRVMPDVHAGMGATVGFTMTVTDKIVPNIVGVDIGCGMETVKIKEKHIELQKLDKLIHERIPSGFSLRKNTHKYFEKTDIISLYCYDKVNQIRMEKGFGTLGGGNHFIEADKDEEGNIYIVVHSGSRHLGLDVATYYQNTAYHVLNSSDDGAVAQLVSQLKSEGKKRKNIETEIKKLKSTKQTDIPKHLAYVSGELFDMYIHDMKIVQEYAMLNRQAIIDEIIKGMKLHVIEQFTTVHNYVDTENMILRKGAVSAQSGEKLIIPINMRDGSLICTGKGNKDWNFSAPHGAGRLMSRSEAKNSFTVSEYKKQMNGIFSTSVGKSTLDECPMAYKPLNDIIGNISPTADIVNVIKPIYNFKAGNEWSN